MKPFDLFLALLVVVLWGVNFIALKIGVGQVPPLFFTGVRFLMVAVLLARHLVPGGLPFARVLVLSFVLGTLHFGLSVVGLTGVDVAVTSVIMQLGVPFSAILAWLVLGDRFGWRRALGMAVAFAGVVVLAGEARTASRLPLVLLLVASSLAWAASNILIKRVGAVDPFRLNAWVALLAAPQLIGLSLVLEGGQVEALIAADWRFWGAFVYSVVLSSLVAYGLWYHLMGKYEVSLLVPTNMLVPVVGGAAAALALGEAVTWERALGAAITLAGVGLIQLRWRRAARRLS